MRQVRETCKYHSFDVKLSLRKELGDILSNTVISIVLCHWHPSSFSNICLVLLLQENILRQSGFEVELEEIRTHLDCCKGGKLRILSLLNPLVVNMLLSRAPPQDFSCTEFYSRSKVLCDWDLPTTVNVSRNIMQPAPLKPNSDQSLLSPYSINISANIRFENKWNV